MSTYIQNKTRYVTKRHALERSFLKKWHNQVLAICDIDPAEVPCTTDRVKLSVKVRLGTYSG
jgi:hypothetical protein